MAPDTHCARRLVCAHGRTRTCMLVRVSPVGRRPPPIPCVMCGRPHTGAPGCQARASPAVCEAGAARCRLAAHRVCARARTCALLCVSVCVPRHLSRCAHVRVRVATRTRAPGWCHAARHLRHTIEVVRVGGGAAPHHSGAQLVRMHVSSHAAVRRKHYRLQRLARGVPLGAPPSCCAQLYGASHTVRSCGPCV